VNGVVKKQYFLYGPHAEANIKNGNGRTYPIPVLEKNVNRLNEKDIPMKRMLGECGHPSNIEINYERVTHCTESLVMDGNLAIGKSFIYEEGLGKIIRSFIDRGTKVCTSTRGTGTLKDNIVQNDYFWKTNDLVHDPSGPSCFLDMVAESKDWVIENGLLVEKDRDQLLKKLDKVILEHQFSIDDRKAAFLKLFNDSLTKIQNKLLL
jgi:hypothetical protein